MQACFCILITKLRCGPTAGSPWISSTPPSPRIGSGSTSTTTTTMARERGPVKAHLQLGGSKKVDLTKKGDMLEKDMTVRRQQNINVLQNANNESII